MWRGRFESETHGDVEAFTASVDVDKRLAPYDLMGSIAHVAMLAKAGILKPEEAVPLRRGLRKLFAQVERGQFEWKAELEDVHMNLESALTREAGDVGKRLHTARSRNDQVAVDTRMWLRDALLDVAFAIVQLQRVLVELASRHRETVMPGFTHMQHAQPILLAHHFLAHVNRLQRDLERAIDAYKRVNVSPLGAGALAGTSHDTDPAFTAKLLGFDSSFHNSLDAVSDRDFAAESLFACSLLMGHLSAMAEEIVLWNTPEFGFVTLSDAVATGSSLMPQKKNPDVAELVRGKSAAVFGELTAFLALLKGLPLAYNRDLQEDKAILFRGVDNSLSSTRLMARLLEHTTFNATRMREQANVGHMDATDLADYLVRKDIPFREAHEIAGRLVRYAEEEGRTLSELSLGEYKEFCGAIDEDVFKVLGVEASVKNKRSPGSTAPKEVERQLDRAKAYLVENALWAEEQRKRLEACYEALLAE